MTEWLESGNTCNDCDEHAGIACMNVNSDHYAHYVLPIHPVCEHAIILKETEYVHHVNCEVHDGGKCGCRSE